MNSDLAIETVACEDGMFVLRVRGRLDARSAPLLSSRCVELRGQGRRLILNMSGVTFIASSGIGALLAMVEECRHAGTKVRFAEVSQPVDSVIRLLNLQQFLSICASEAQARGESEAA